MELEEKSPSLEKRKYPRFNIDLPLKYSRTNLFFRFSKFGRAVNASDGGLLVHFPEEMAIGQRLALKLLFPSLSEFDTREVFVQVVWKDIHLRKDWSWDYRTGVRFVDVPPEHTAQLKNFLANSAQNPPHPA